MTEERRGFASMSPARRTEVSRMGIAARCLAHPRQPPKPGWSASDHPTRERLIELLDVDLQAGELRWRQTAAHHVAGRLIGRINKDGYRQVQIDGRHAMAHIVIWFMATGEWLPGKIDHRDRVRSHNAIENLRPATQSQQLANTSVSRKNTSGAKGIVNIGSGPRPYWARIMVRGTRLSLGYFTTLDEAKRAYRVASIEHFGEFSSEAEAL